MQWYKQLHWQIIIGLILGVVFGLIAVMAGWEQATADWVAPFGTIFVNLLKLVAIPLVVTSLIVGISSLSDLKQLSRMGGKTIGIYIVTTVVAVTIGLIVVNSLQPGKQLPPELKDRLRTTYEQEASSSAQAAEQTKDRGPLQPLVEMVPENAFGALGSNQNMLQVVFVSLLIGIALVQLRSDQAQPVRNLLEGLNSLIIHLVHIVMLMAPLGVFALMADTITSLARGSQVWELIGALGFYCMAVVLGLLIQALGVYPLMLKLFSKTSFKKFFSGIAPAQLVAFSTSSSGATLPVTMEQCKEKLGVSDEVASFVLPLGATINMDGTALYQAVAAVFIAQALALQLGIQAQLTIIFTAVLASIGTAAVPGAGIIMLVIILESIQVPSGGIALILGVDRILDMLRTVTNITGDATVSVIVASSENQLHAVPSTQAIQVESN